MSPLALRPDWVFKNHHDPQSLLSLLISGVINAPVIYSHLESREIQRDGMRQPRRGRRGEEMKSFSEFGKESLNNLPFAISIFHLAGQRRTGKHKKRSKMTQEDGLE